MIYNKFLIDYLLNRCYIIIVPTFNNYSLCFEAYAYKRSNKKLLLNKKPSNQLEHNQMLLTENRYCYYYKKYFYFFTDIFFIALPFTSFTLSWVFTNYSGYIVILSYIISMYASAVKAMSSLSKTIILGIEKLIYYGY